mmetsp:Transcript_16753/g.38734  ORF Transcript_16753/g.38734 Transcript_16753/m.38734 type:complete len:266 (-) Transcript_16753:1107-1904(-)
MSRAMTSGLRRGLKVSRSFAERALPPTATFVVSLFSDMASATFVTLLASILQFSRFTSTMALFVDKVLARREPVSPSKWVPARDTFFTASLWPSASAMATPPFGPKLQLDKPTSFKVLLPLMQWLNDSAVLSDTDTSVMVNFSMPAGACSTASAMLFTAASVKPPPPMLISLRFGLCLMPSASFSAVLSVIVFPPRCIFWRLLFPCTKDATPAVLFADIPQLPKSTSFKPSFCWKASTRLSAALSLNLFPLKDTFCKPPRLSFSA